MSDNWNDDWRDELQEKNYNCYLRLCECRNTKNDLKIIAKIMFKYNVGKGAQDCLDRTISWLTDWNNQVDLIPLKEEYDEILEYLERK